MSKYSYLIITLVLAFTMPAKACWAGTSSDIQTISQVTKCHEPNKLLSVERKFKDGLNISVEVELKSVEACKLSKMRGFYWSEGGDGEIHNSLVTGMTIVVNGKPINVYVSAFSDLADIQSVRLDRKGKEYIIRLKSTGEEPYVADLVIMYGELVERRVYFPLFPDEAYEQTIYHFTVK